MKIFLYLLLVFTALASLAQTEKVTAETAPRVRISREE
jgi:hypothetical protein